jgi:DNA-binding NarL/FixJ family response regulator
VQRARVLLADDHDDFLLVAARLLKPEFRVVGAVGEGQAALDAAARLSPDVVVLDVSMPVLGGVEACRRLRVACPAVRVVFLTAHEDPGFVWAALEAGAHGYVVKSLAADDLAGALRAVLAGRPFVSHPAGRP